MRNWVPERTLLSLVFEAIHNAETPADGSPMTPLPVGNTRVLIAVALFSYARGMLGSDEIAAASNGDSSLRYLAANTVVEACEIRRVRRYHREELERALSELLRLCWERQTWITAPELTDRPLTCPAEISRALAQDGERRLNDAVRADSMALDI